MEANKLITLRSKDDKTVTVSEQAALRSKVLNDVLKDYVDAEIPLPEVEEKTLKKVVDYLEHFKDKEPEEIPQPLVDSNIKRALNDQFLEQYIIGYPLDDCFDLINAANYMDIHSLLNLVCAYVASQLFDEEPETIRQKLGIESDMTEEEKKEYQKYSLE